MNKKTKSFIYNIVFFAFFLAFLKLDLYANRIITLKEAEKIALKNSFDLRSNKLKLHITKISKWEAFRNFLPRFSVIYEHDRIINENNNTTSNNALGFRVSQVIFDGGKSIMSYKIVKLDQRISKTKIEEIKRSIIVSVRESYFKVLGAKLNLEISKAVLKQMNEEIKITEAEVRVGQRTQLELLEMKSKLGEVEVQVHFSDNAYKVELMKLRFLIGININSKVFIKGKIKSDFKPRSIKYSVKKLIRNAIARRVELKRLRYEMRQESFERFLRENNYLPTLSVSFEHRWFDEVFPLKKREWSLFFKLSFYLGGSEMSSQGYYKRSTDPSTSSIGVDSDLEILQRPFKDLRERTESRLKYLTAKNNLKEFIKKIKLDIHEAYKSYKLSIKIFEIMFKKVKVEEMRYRILKESIKAGVRKKSDLAEAEVDYLKSKVGLSDAIVKYLVSIAKLESVAGYNFGRLGMYVNYE